MDNGEERAPSKKRARSENSPDLNNSLMQRFAARVSRIFQKPIRNWLNSSKEEEDDDVYQDCINEPSYISSPAPKRLRIASDETIPAGTLPIKWKRSRQSAIIGDNFDETVPGPSRIRNLVTSTPAVSTERYYGQNQRRKISNLGVNTNSLAAVTENDASANVTDDDSVSGESTSDCSSMNPQNSQLEQSSISDSKLSFQVGHSLNSTRRQSLRFNNIRNPAKETLRSRTEPSYYESPTRDLVLKSPNYTWRRGPERDNSLDLARSRQLSKTLNNPYLQKAQKRAAERKASRTTGVGAKKTDLMETTKIIIESLRNHSTPIQDAMKMPIKRSISPLFKKEKVGVSPQRVIGLRHLSKHVIPNKSKIMQMSYLKQLTTTTQTPKNGPTLDSEIKKTSCESSTNATVNTQVSSLEKLPGTNKEKANDEKSTLKRQDEKFTSPELLPSSCPKRDSIAGNTQDVELGDLTFHFSNPATIPDTPKHISLMTSFKFSEPTEMAPKPTISDGDESVAKTLPEKSKESLTSGVGTEMEKVFEKKKGEEPKIKKIVFWECKYCLLSNVMEHDHCFACKQHKSWAPKNNSPEKPSKPTSEQILEKLHDRWECQFCKCQIRNAHTHCSRCLKPKPGVECNGDLESIYKMVTEPWKCSYCKKKVHALSLECDSCMTPKPGKPVSPIKMESKNPWTCRACNTLIQPPTPACPYCTANEPRPNIEESPKKQAQEPDQNSELSESCDESEAPTPKKWTCSKCELVHAEDVETCPCEETVKSSELENNDKSPVKKMQGFGDMFKKAPGSWECEACMLKNNAEAKKCVACETSKPGMEKETTSSLTNNVFGFGDKFKKAPGSWECEACMLKNNSDAKKCVACETTKPGIEKETTNNVFGFGDKFKKAPGSWECKACMVKNNAEAKKCVACETTKPGMEKETTSSLTNNVSGFGDKFKKAPGSWECEACMLKNTAEAKKCVACETVKPDEKAEQTPKFSFGVPPGMKFQFGTGQTSTSSSGTVTCNGFGFGISGTVNTVKTFSFGASIPSNTQAAVLPPVFGALQEKKEDAPPVGFTPPMFLARPSEKSEPTVTATVAPAVVQPTLAPVINPSAPTQTVASSTSSTPFTFGAVVPKPAVTTEAPSVFSVPSSGTTQPCVFPSFGAGAEKPIAPPVSSTAPMATSEPAFGSVFSRLGKKLEPAAKFEFTSSTTPFPQAAPQPAALATGFAFPSWNPPSAPSTPSTGIFSSGINPPTQEASSTPQTAVLFGSAVNTATPNIPSQPTTSMFGSTMSNPATPNVSKQPTTGIFGSGISTPVTSNAPASNGIFSSQLSTPGPNNPPSFEINPSFSSSNSMFGSGSFNSGPSVPPAATPLFGNGGGLSFPSSSTTSTPFPSSSGFNTLTPATANTGFPNPGSSGFGMASSSTTSNIFGAPQIGGVTTFGRPFNATPEANASNANAQAVSSGNSGFNFNVPGSTMPSFNPNTAVSFNFTRGNAPPVFNASPSTTPSQALPRRPFRKAVRRMANSPKARNGS